MRILSAASSLLISVAAATEAPATASPAARMSPIAYECNRAAIARSERANAEFERGSRRLSSVERFKLYESLASAYRDCAFAHSRGQKGFLDTPLDERSTAAVYELNAAAAAKQQGNSKACWSAFATGIRDFEAVASDNTHFSRESTGPGAKKAAIEALNKYLRATKKWCLDRQAT